jgi:hypothetical protein
VFVLPAFSSNEASDTGPAQSLPNAWLSTTVGFGMFFETRTFIPKTRSGPKLPAPKT